MQIIITKHAKEAFRTRVGCDVAKYQKLTDKAWRSKEPVSDGDITNRGFYEQTKSEANVYRKLMGRIFVFAENNEHKAVLVTIYPPASQIAKRSQKAKRLAAFYGDPKCPMLPNNLQKRKAYEDHDKR